MNEEIEMSMDDLIDYLDFEKSKGSNKITRDDAIMMVENTFNETELKQIMKMIKMIKIKS